MLSPVQVGADLTDWG